MAKTAADGQNLTRPWGRLKNVKIDPLESIGLPSKGDNRHEDPLVHGKITS